MKIKIIARFEHNGERKELLEEIRCLISDPPEKKDATRLSNMIKEYFEDKLNRTVVVKTKIRNDEFIAAVNIRNAP